MKDRKQRLLLMQTSRHLNWFNDARAQSNPPEGWVKTIRTALNMTLAQLANRMKISIPSVKNFETREKLGTVTIKSLREIAEALDMQLVYAIIPKADSLEDYVDRKAEEKAKEIYENLFEPALGTLKRVKKAEELSRSKMGYREGSKGDAQYREKLMSLSKKHYLGENK